MTIPAEPEQHIGFDNQEHFPFTPVKPPLVPASNDRVLVLAIRGSRAS
ncbi:hypothetical protein [Sphingopyxis sp. Geo48]|nr:hypothetical protein [Sphingopyxis sp. Geo48]